MKKILFCAFAMVLLNSCKKEQESFCVDAVVRWGGDPAADGMGWHLVGDSTRNIYYIPRNLSDNYKKDGLRVNVCMYQTNEKFNCMCTSPILKYHITSIRKT